MGDPGQWRDLDREALRDRLLHADGQWLVTVSDPRDQVFLVFRASHGHFRQTGEGLEIELRAEPVVAGGRFMLLAHDFQSTGEADEGGRDVIRVELGSYTVRLEQHGSPTG